MSLTVLSRAEMSLVMRLFRSDLTHNRKRIALTILAIAWGTLSIVMLLSFGEGMKRAFRKSKRGMGEYIGILWPGNTTKPFMGLPSGRAIRFTDEDAEILASRIPEIASVSREYSIRRGITNGAKTVNVRIRGVDPPFGELRHIYPQAGGRFVDELDMQEKRRVVVLGDELAADLFGKEEPVGKLVMVNQSAFLVIAVAQPKTMMGMYSGPDKNQATIPATTFKSMFTDRQVATWSTSRPARRRATWPRPRSTGCWAGATTSIPRTGGPSPSGTPARTSASWTTSRWASRSSWGSSAPSPSSWAGWGWPTSCTRW